jgi:hypothetical protein
VALCQARISTKPLWGFSSSNPYHSQSRAEQQICFTGKGNLKLSCTKSSIFKQIGLSLYFGNSIKYIKNNRSFSVDAAENTTRWSWAVVKPTLLRTTNVYSKVSEQIGVH